MNGDFQDYSSLYHAAARLLKHSYSCFISSFSHPFFCSRPTFWNTLFFHPFLQHFFCRYLPHPPTPCASSALSLPTNVNLVPLCVSVSRHQLHLYEPFLSTNSHSAFDFSLRLCLISSVQQRCKPGPLANHSEPKQLFNQFILPFTPPSLAQLRPIINNVHVAKHSHS